MQLALKSKAKEGVSEFGLKKCVDENASAAIKWLKSCLLHKSSPYVYCSDHVIVRSISS